MLSVKIDDLTETAIQQIATKMNIPFNSKTLKAELIEAIKAKYPYASDLTLVPKAFSADPKGWKSPSVIVSIVALVIAIAAATAAWMNAMATLRKIGDEIAESNLACVKEEKQIWQEAKVNEIIFTQCAHADKWSGIGFDQILAKYREEYQSHPNLRPEIAELQPDVLNRILLNLQRFNVIFRTHDNKFFPARSAPASQDCFGKPGAAEMEQAIFKVLAIDSGKYSAERLVKKVAEEVKRKEDEIYQVAACMLSRNMILLDAKGTLWSHFEWKREELLGRNPSGQRIINVPVALPENSIPKVMQPPEPTKAEDKK